MTNLREKAIEIAKQTSSESAFMCGYDRACQEYEEKLRWTPIYELHNPTIPFLGKDKSGKIELFKVANVFYLKALDVVEWRSIL